MSTAPTTVRTHCPTCGAKLHRTDLSLCAYCATPLNIADAPSKVDDATLQRLKRLREHASFPAAMAFRPLDREVEKRCAAILARGTVLVLAALPPGAAAIWCATHAHGWIALAILAGAFAAAGVALLCVPPILRKRSLAEPMMRRPALVVVRRSETSDDRASTTYYFTLRFDDGSEGEFEWPGQGTSYEPLANGYTGIAYTSGTKLVDFRRL